MRVPPHLREIKERLGLQTWVDRKDFPRDVHFRSIDLFKKRLDEHEPEGDDRDEASRNAALAAMIAVALDVEGDLTTYAINKGTYPIADQEVWGRVCLAAGWVVLQRYEREFKNGKWTPDE